MTLRIPLVLDPSGVIQRLQPGDTILQNYGGNVPIMSGTTIIAYSNVAPAITAGTQIFSQVVTPPAIGTIYQIEFSSIVDCGSSSMTVSLALFRDSTFIGMASVDAGSSSRPNVLAIRIIDTPGVLTPVTYSCRVGVSSAATWYLGRGAAASLGGVNSSAWSIWEMN